MVAAVALLSVQTLLIAGLLIHRHRRARAELALVQSQRRLHLIADSLPALIAHVDRDQRYQFVNRAYELWFGLGPSQALGRTIREVLGEPLYRNVRPYVERALSGEEVSFTTQLLRQGGEPRAMEATYVPDCEEQGDVRGFYALVLDVTDRNRAQQEARSLLDELAHADRISMMGELAATLAHELNQPMTAIMSNAQAATRFLDRSSPDLDEVREILREIAEEDARAGEVIRRMRTLVKKERASFQPLDLNETVHEVVWLLRNDAMIRKVGIELQLDPDLPAVSGDRIQLQQVVMNLLLNAFDAIGESSTENRTVLVETSHARCGDPGHGPRLRRGNHPRYARTPVPAVQHLQAERAWHGAVDQPIDRRASWRPPLGREQLRPGSNVLLHAARRSGARAGGR